MKPDLKPGSQGVVQNLPLATRRFTPKTVTQKALQHQTPEYAWQVRVVRA